MTPASLVQRVAALAYETLLVAAIVIVAGFVLAPLVTPAATGRWELRMPALADRALIFCALFAVTAAYFVFSWSGGRRTLAMKTWRLRLVALDGGTLERKRALARYLAAWIGPGLALVAYAALRPRGLGAHAVWLVAFNFIWALIDPQRQFLHDRIAGTRIIRGN